MRGDHAVAFFMLNVGTQTLISCIFSTSTTVARLAQSVEHQTFNLRVAGSSPSSGVSFCN